VFLQWIPGDLPKRPHRLLVPELCRYLQEMSNIVSFPWSETILGWRYVMRVLCLEVDRALSAGLKAVEPMGAQGWVTKRFVYRQHADSGTLLIFGGHGLVPVEERCTHKRLLVRAMELGVLPRELTVESVTGAGTIYGDRNLSWSASSIALADTPHEFRPQITNVLLPRAK